MVMSIGSEKTRAPPAARPESRKTLRVSVLSGEADRDTSIRRSIEWGRRKRLFGTLVAAFGCVNPRLRLLDRACESYRRGLSYSALRGVAGIVDPAQ